MFVLSTILSVNVVCSHFEMRNCESPNPVFSFALKIFIYSLILSVCAWVFVCSHMCRSLWRWEENVSFPALEVVSPVSGGNQTGLFWEHRVPSTTLPSLQPQLCSSLKEHFGYMESLQDVTWVLGQVFPVSADNAISGFCRNCIESVYCFWWCS